MITGTVPACGGITPTQARWLRHAHRGGRPPGGDWLQKEPGEDLVLLRPLDDLRLPDWVDTAHLAPRDALHVTALGQALVDAAGHITHVTTIADLAYRAEWLLADRDAFLETLPPGDARSDQVRAEEAGFTALDPDVIKALVAEHARAPLPGPGHALWPLRARIDALARTLDPCRPGPGGAARYLDDTHDTPMTAGYVMLARTPQEARLLRILVEEEEQQADMMGMDPPPSAVFDLRDPADTRALRLNVARRTHALREVHRILEALKAYAAPAS